MKLPLDFGKVKGFMDPDEGQCLFEVALEISKSGPVLEIGSYCGKSTIYLAMACKENESCIYSVDHHMGSEENQVGWEYHDEDLYDEDTGRINSFPEFLKNIRNAGLLDTVIPIVCDSSLAAKYWQTPLSMVFIDGGHTIEAAESDYKNWNTKIIKGGILAIHDVFPDPKDGGRPPYEIYKRAISEGHFSDERIEKSLRVLKKLD